MALKEQDIVFTGKDSSGNTIIQMPITRAANVEDLTSTCLPLAGGTMTGGIKFNGNGSVMGSADSSSVQMYGSTAWNAGSMIGVYGKSHANRPGWLYLSAHDGTNSHVLIGKPDGTLTWGGKSLVGGIPAVSGASVTVNATPTDGTAYQYTMPNDGLVELSCQAGVGRSYHYEYGGDTGSGSDSQWYENEGNTIMSVKVGDVFVYPSKTVTKDSQSYSGIFFAKKGQKIEVLCDRTTTTSSYIKYAIAHSFSVTVHPH